ncbi:MAG: hypothetical protein JRC67_02895, partial [Deltaproteobacteria bacterium]|nr:hypothetical protein [Deltaproteobacteria bacterium]
RDLQKQLRKQRAAQDFEEEIDRQFLLHNMAGVLIELEEVQSWRHNPLIYLKVCCIGVDHAVNKPAADGQERFDRTAERLAGLNGLLRQAGKNLSTIPGPYYRVSLAVVQDAQKYLDEILFEFDGHSRREQLALPCAEAQEALAKLGRQPRRRFSRLR